MRCRSLASRETSAPPRASAPRWPSNKRKSPFSNRQSVISSIYFLLLLHCAGAFHSQAQFSGLAALNMWEKSKTRKSNPQNAETVFQGKKGTMVLPAPPISLTYRLRDELIALDIWSPQKKPAPKIVLQVDAEDPRFTSAPIPLSYRLRDTSPVDATAGVLFAFGILIILGASTTEPDVVIALVEEDGVWDGLAKQTLSNLFDATVPNSAADVIAVTLGESIGGVIGAVGTAMVSLVMTRQMPSLNSRGMTKSLMTEAIADSDFFIANSASRPLLQAAGLPPVLASVGSLVVATVSSQLVKLGARRKQGLLEEGQLLQKLLEEQQEKERKRAPLKFLLKGFNNKETYLSPKDLVPVAEVKIDFIDVFSDVARWLEYGILKADYQDTLLYNGVVVDTAVSGAFFGLLAAVSSQLYADILYGYFRKGPEYKQIEVRSRNVFDWATVYISTSISAAALFGIYELSHRPVSRYLQGMLAGGVEGCVGSNSFDFCLQTYIDANAPGPSPEAQLRALYTNLVMVGERLQVIAVDTSADDMQALVAGWAVATHSFFFHDLSQMLPALGNL
jgi:hypothetical protein